MKLFSRALKSAPVPQSTSTGTSAMREGWLDVSIEGFAEQNAARPVEHLVKELVQNALDSLPPEGGMVRLDMMAAGENTLIRCADDGCGMDDLLLIRTVFWTSKKDSHLRRGRMGRGFKEMLCLALEAEVASKGGTLRFLKQDGQPIMNLQHDSGEGAGAPGTSVTMTMPWNAAECLPTLEGYFARFILPANVRFVVNGRTVKARQPEQQVETTLTTEAFVAARWQKPQRRTTLELVRCLDGEEASIYEMGIPVCSVEWDQPYHVNVLQRVPMNPNRDAVMSGYPAKIHKACLEALLPDLEPEQARAAWVGEAAKALAPETQDVVLQKAFGENLARSVPGFGKYSADDDAREKGVLVLDTRQLQGGFRDLARSRLPSSNQVVDRIQQTEREEATKQQVDLETLEGSHLVAVNLAGGQQRVMRILEFAQWFCQGVLLRLGETASCTARAALLGPEVMAHWNAATATLTVSLNNPSLWRHPFGQDFLETLIHEVAHQRAAHHGLAFVQSMEQCGAHACRLVYDEREHLDRLLAAIAHA